MRHINWIVVVAVTTVPVHALAQRLGEGFDHGHMFEWGWGHMIFGSLFMLLFWVAFIVAVIAAVRWLISVGQGSSRMASGDSSLDVLRERFARGEIDREEFEERRRVLTGR